MLLWDNFLTSSWFSIISSYELSFFFTSRTRTSPIMGECLSVSDYHRQSSLPSNGGFLFFKSIHMENGSTRIEGFVKDKRDFKSDNLPYALLVVLGNGETIKVNIPLGMKHMMSGIEIWARVIVENTWSWPKTIATFPSIPKVPDSKQSTHAVFQWAMSLAPA